MPTSMNDDACPKQWPRGLVASTDITSRHRVWSDEAVETCTTSKPSGDQKVNGHAAL
jgi:hypothetical protein